jgi:hypothetical protein
VPGAGGELRRGHASRRAPRVNFPIAATAPPQALRGRPLLGALPRSGEDHEAVGVHVQERLDLLETAAAELGQ